MFRWHVNRLIRRYRRDLRHLESLKRKRLGSSSVEEFKAKVIASKPEEKIRLLNHSLIKEEAGYLSDMFVRAQAELRDKELQHVFLRLKINIEEINKRLRNFVIFFDSFCNKAVEHEALLKSQMLRKEVDYEKINKLEHQLIDRYGQYKDLVMANLERTIHDIEASSWHSVRSQSALRSMAASVVLALAAGFGGTVISPSSIYAEENAAEQKGGEKKTIEEEIADLEKKAEAKPTAELYVKLSDAYYKKGDVDKFGYYAKEAIRLDKNNAGAHNNLGYYYLKTKDYKNSGIELELAIRLDPRLIEAHFNLGLLNFYTKNYEKSIEEYNEVLRLNPNHAKAYKEIGVCYYYLSRFKESLEQFDKALRIDPSFKDALSWRSVVLKKI